MNKCKLTSNPKKNKNRFQYLKNLSVVYIESDYFHVNLIFDQSNFNQTIRIYLQKNLIMENN